MADDLPRSTGSSRPGRHAARRRRRPARRARRDQRLPRRRGAARRSARIVQTHVQAVDDDHALVVAITELERGGRGQQTQLWARLAGRLGGHRRPRRGARRRRSTPGSGGSSATRCVPATADGPLDGQTVAVKDLYAVAGHAGRRRQPGLAGPGAGRDGARLGGRRGCSTPAPPCAASRAPTSSPTARRHQRPLRHAAQPRGRRTGSPAARPPASASAVVARPRDHRARHRHRRLDPGAGVLPGAVRASAPPTTPCRATGCSPLAAVLRHRRLAGPRRCDRWRPSATCCCRPATADARAGPGRRAGSDRPRRARRRAASRRFARASARPAEGWDARRPRRPGSPPSRPCRRGRRGGARRPGCRRRLDTLGADVRGRFEAASLIDPRPAERAGRLVGRPRDADPRAGRRPGAGAAVGVVGRTADRRPALAARRATRPCGSPAWPGSAACRP